MEKILKVKLNVTLKSRKLEQGILLAGTILEDPIPEVILEEHAEGRRTPDGKDFVEVLEVEKTKGAEFKTENSGEESTSAGEASAGAEQDEKPEHQCPGRVLPFFQPIQEH